MINTVFFDVDTQVDFLFPAGALAVPGAAAMVNSLRALTSFAAKNQIPIISTADAHTENDPEFQTWKPHCVVGTAGQLKAAGTILDKPYVLSTTPGSFDSRTVEIRPANQFIIEKQTVDCFTNPNLRLLLDSLQAHQYVVYGVVTEVCVQYAAFGLLKLGAKVELVADAVKSLSRSDEESMFKRFESAGGKLTTTAAVLSKQRLNLNSEIRTLN